MFTTDRRLILASSVLAIVIGAASGIASGGFLLALDAATDLQTSNPWLLYFLPLAGVLIAWAYTGYGSSAAGGNNLLIDQIHATDNVNRVPLRLLPLVLGATILTHLFGGSAGREGTAVQMGGALAGWAGRTLRVSPALLRLLLMCGISAGFAGVFGTPLAGTIFALEVLALGGLRYDGLIPCLIAAVVADLVVRDALQVHHGIYGVASGFPELTLRVMMLVTLAGVGFGLTSLLFAEATVLVERWSKRLVADPMVRTFLGGCLVIAITLTLGTRDYNGLSLPLLQQAFSPAAAEIPPLAFLAKLLLTTVTIGVGFKGGEVTPLFVIGATLGVTMAGPLGLPPDTLAALGFVAVFAAAANTPLACVLMGLEIFGVGSSAVVLIGIAVFVAYTISGHRGIYHAQRILTPKYLQSAPDLVGVSLHDVRTRSEGNGSVPANRPEVTTPVFNDPGEEAGSSSQG